jgi:hypothetical protein
MAQLTFIEHMGMSWPPPMSPWSMWLWSMAAWWEWSIVLMVFSSFLFLLVGF